MNMMGGMVLTVRSPEGREAPIATASVDRMRHTVTYNQSGVACYELRMWSGTRRVGMFMCVNEAVPQLAAEVAARHGAGRLEIGMDWGTSIFYLVLALSGVAVMGVILFAILTGQLGVAGGFVMLPLLALLGYAIQRTMRGRWPPRRAGSVEGFLAVLDGR